LDVKTGLVKVYSYAGGFGFKTKPEEWLIMLTEIETLHDLRSSYVPEGTHVFIYVCIYKGVQLKSKFQNTGT
jgi:hypothetical protein